MKLIDLYYEIWESYFDGSSILHLSAVTNHDGIAIRMQWDTPPSGHFFSPDMINNYPFKEEPDLR